MQGSAGFRLYHSWSLRLKLAQQAAAAIAYMHEANVIHRDVTANNILVTENYEAKVGFVRRHAGHKLSDIVLEGRMSGCMHMAGYVSWCFLPAEGPADV